MRLPGSRAGPDATEPSGEVVISISDLGEFPAIARIVARLPVGAGVRVGPGDDAAVLDGDPPVVASVDLLVSGRHFDPSWSGPQDVGRRAAAANLADVAAMGARPTALLVGLAAPADLPMSWAEGLADGLAAECALVGASVVGGDLVQSATLTIAVTALGRLERDRPVTRAGAGPGDTVVLAGRLGFAAAGLAVLRSGDPQLVRRHAVLVQAHRHPDVPYPMAVALADAGATAMADISDGLAGDAGHIADRSGVALHLTAGALPVAPELVAAGHDLDVDPLQWVAAGGDDHAFLATVPPAAPVPAATARWPVTRIGAVQPGVGVRWTDREPPGAGGHQHFTAP